MDDLFGLWKVLEFKRRDCGRDRIMPRVERRRKWTEAEKAALLAEADEPGSSVVAVALER